MTTDVKASAEAQLTLRRVVRVLIALGLCCWAYWAACLSSKGMTFGDIDVTVTDVYQEYRENFEQMEG